MIKIESLEKQGKAMLVAFFNQVQDILVIPKVIKSMKTYSVELPIRPIINQLYDENNHCKDFLFFTF